MDDRHLIGGRYKIAHLLGRGGMGTVHYGTDIRTGQPIALKMLTPELDAGDPEMVERFAREAKALRALNHPNIVTVLETFSEKAVATGAMTQYIVMEYAAGGSLRERLSREGQLDLNAALETSLDLADALTRAHRLRILHRDIKPANVLLAEDGTPRLSDFGIARFGDARQDDGPRLTQAGAIVGTVDYLSPEALRSEELDVRADIWAFGVMLFEMLAGRRPFPDQSITPTIVTTITAILTQSVPDLELLRPDAPDRLVDLIYRMLTKEREARIPSMRLVGAELEAILEDIVRAKKGAQRRADDGAAAHFATPTPYPTGIARHNLPEQTTPFIGREVELADLMSLIADPENRLITLLGPGGSGKTRLALEAVRAQLRNFAGGIIFVPLASVSAVEEIIPAIAEAVGFQFFERVEPAEQLFDFLRARQTLLVLDNLEHLLDSTDLISEMLRAAPGVKVLVTSREKLNLQEEIRYRIEGLAFPEGAQPTSLEDAFRYNAIKLFMQAAQRARPGFELETEDLSHATSICRLVRGMPLGILLAAAWVEMFSPQEIAVEVARSLDFLETEVTDIPARHRSIRAVFDSSWRQLSEDDRDVFMKLAIFRGGFKREAAQTVAGARLNKLIALVRKSLLYRDPTSGRYEVHELLRQYAEEHLEAFGEVVETRNAHCAYFSTFLQQRLTGMLGPRQTAALDEIEAEFGNVRQAWRWAVKRKEFDAIDRSWESLFVYSDMRSREHEGVALFESARRQLAPQGGEEPHPTWGRLLLPWYDLMLQSKGRLKDEQEIKWQAESSLMWAQERDDQLGHALGLILLAHFSQPGEGLKLYEQALALCPRLDDSFWVRIRIGFSYQALGEYQEAISAFQRSYERGCEIDESEKMGWSLYNIGETEITLGDHVNAATHLRRANNHLRQVGTLLGVVWTNAKLSLLALLTGDLEEARSLVEEAQEVARDVNRSEAIKRESLIALGYLALAESDYRKARQWFEELLSAFTTSPEASLGLCFAACGLEDYSTARGKLGDALQPASPYLVPGMAILCLPAAALILSDEGEKEWAVESLALACDHPAGPKGLLERWPLLTQLIAELAAGPASQTYDAAWVRGRKLDLTEALTALGVHFTFE